MGLGLGIMIKIRLRMATPPHPYMVLLQLCAIAGVLPQFRRNSGAIRRNCTCDWAGLATGLGRHKISNAYRYWPGAGWKRHRAPPMTNQAGKNTRRKDDWRELARWARRRGWAGSR